LDLRESNEQFAKVAQGVKWVLLAMVKMILRMKWFLKKMGRYLNDVTCPVMTVKKLEVVVKTDE